MWPEDHGRLRQWPSTAEQHAGLITVGSASECSSEAIASPAVGCGHAPTEEHAMTPSAWQASLRTKSYFNLDCASFCSLERLSRLLLILAIALY